MFKFLINKNTPSTYSNETKKIASYLFVILFFPFLLFNQPGLEIDPSWRLAINLAVVKKLIFGKEFIFTYGPLGFLSTKFVDMVPVYFPIIFTLFLYIISFRLINILYKHINLAILLLSLYVLKLLYINNSEFYLFLISCFLLLSYNRNKKTADLVIVSISSVFLFYMKVNTGLILTVAYLFNIIILLVYKKLRIKLSTYLLLFTISLHLLVISTVRLDFWDYIFNSLKMIRYYNQSMYNEPYFEFILITLFALFNTVYILFKISKAGFDRPEKILLANFLLILFISYKQSILRGDSWHNSAIILVCLFIILISNYFYHNKFVFIQLLLIFIPFVWYMINNDNYKSFFDTSNVIMHFEEDLTLKNQNTNYENSVNFPNKWTEMIGNSSVDIIPYFISIIYYKKLNYNPRPIIQSYSAYCEDFEQLNYNHFTNNSSPEFVILHDGTIDKRPPFWDDNLLKIALSYNYTLIDTTSTTYNSKHLKLLLFKKNKTLRRIVFKKIKEDVFELNLQYQIPIFNEPILMKATIESNILGKMQDFVYQPSPINLLMQKNNEKLNYMGVIPILKSGVIVNRPLNDKNDPSSFDLSAVSNYFLTKGIYKDDSIKITFSGNPLKFKKEIKIEFYKISPL